MPDILNSIFALTRIILIAPTLVLISQRESCGTEKLITCSKSYSLLVTQSGFKPTQSVAILRKWWAGRHLRYFPALCLSDFAFSLEHTLVSSYKYTHILSLISSFPIDCMLNCIWFLAFSLSFISSQLHKIAHLASCAQLQKPNFIAFREPILFKISIRNILSWL